MTGGKRLAGAVVWLSVAIGAAFLGLRSYQGLDVARDMITPESLAGTRFAYRHYQCLEDAFRAQVPVGAKVYIDMEGMPAYTAFSAAFPDREVVAQPGRADVVFGYVDPALADPCAPGTFRSAPPVPDS